MSIRSFTFSSFPFIFLACGPSTTPDQEPTSGSSGGTGGADGVGVGGGVFNSGGTSGEPGPTSGGTSGTGGAVIGNSGGASAIGSGGGTTQSGGASSGGGTSQSGGASSGASVCDQAGVLLCENFESAETGQTPGSPWSLAANGTDGTATIDAITPAQSGTQSLKVDSLGNYQIFLAITGAPVFPAPTPALYARVYIRLDEAMTGGHNTYFKAGAAGAISSNNETRVGVMNEMLMINQPDGDRGFLSNQNYWNDQLPGVVIAPGTWTCIEGYFDPPNSTVQFWVDETEVPDLHVTDWQQDALGSFQFGFEQYAGPAAVIWYDDIVISTQPIGCGAI